MLHDLTAEWYEIVSFYFADYGLFFVDKSYTS
jgi:hypothetical protein